MSGEPTWCPVERAEQLRDLEESGLNIPLERDEDTEYERYVQERMAKDKKDVAKALREFYTERLEDTNIKLVTLIDSARRGR